MSFWQAGGHPGLPGFLVFLCRPPDTFIQKTKQRYNSPRSLSTKLNLADMQTEIKLRPPYQLSPEDLRAVNGCSPHAPSKYKGLGVRRPPDIGPPPVWAAASAMSLSVPPVPSQTLEPVSLPGVVSCVLSVLCGGLNLLRGVHAIESVLQVRGSRDLCVSSDLTLKRRLFSRRTARKTLIT